MSPLNRARTNPVQAAYIGVYRNVCGIILNVKFEKDDEDVNAEDYALSFGNIRRWIEANYGIKVSNGSISQVMKKCEMKKLEVGAGKLAVQLQTEKEKLVYEAFKHFNVVNVS